MSAGVRIRGALGSRPAAIRCVGPHHHRVAEKDCVYSAQMNSRAELHRIRNNLSVLPPTVTLSSTFGNARTLVMHTNIFCEGDRICQMVFLAAAKAGRTLPAALHRPNSLLCNNIWEKGENMSQMICNDELRLSIAFYSVLLSKSSLPKQKQSSGSAKLLKSQDLIKIPEYPFVSILERAPLSYICVN